MATLDELRALETRLESATGPDRELDARIWWHLMQPRYAVVDAELRIMAEMHNYPLDESRSGAVIALQDFLRNPICSEVTKSLDAAIALIEACAPDYTVNLHFSPATKHFRPDVKLWKHHDLTYAGDADAEAATPPLAICLALIRALAQKEQNK